MCIGQFKFLMQALSVLTSNVSVVELNDYLKG